ncbi:MAG: S41 family peptidase [Asgard group archaeon]|nr:S41 family peptidase [Asgard group archaeon]
MYRIRSRRIFMSKIKQISEIKLDKKLKLEIINEISKLLVERYIFKDIAKKIEERLLNDYKNGVFDSIDNIQLFASEIEKNFAEVSNDGHLHIMFDPSEMERIIARRELSKEEIKRIHQKKIDGEKQSNFGFKKIEILDGNIGYLDLRRFCHTNYAAEIAIAAMNYLSNTDAVIIDLRKNGGGEPEMVLLLASYFLGGRVLFNTIDRPFEEITEQYWTQVHVPGNLMKEKDLYILTSKRTYSAAESFSYGMKCQKRAMIIGETTGGGAHPLDFHSILDLLVLWLPTGRAINPISKTNWEGVGVEPDISVSSEEAFDKAYELVLGKLIDNTKDTNLKLFLEFTKVKLESKSVDVKVSKKTLQSYQGKYDKGQVEFDGINLYYQSPRRDKIKLKPLSDNFFAFAEDNLASIGLLFKKNKETEEMELFFLYDEEKEIFKKVRISD